MAVPLRCSLHTPPPSLPPSFPSSSSSSSHSLLKFSPPNSLKFTLPALRPRSNHHRLSFSSLTASASLSAVDSPESSHIQNEKKLLLEVKGLSAVIAESKQQILKGVNLTIYEGEVHAIMGKNGSGKSTLAKVLVGHPDYEVTGGSVVFKGENLVEMEPEERSLGPIEVLGADLAILDEIDSGLDVDALRDVAAAVNGLLTPKNSVLMITHYARLLNIIKPTYIHVMEDGKILRMGDSSIAKLLEDEGYQAISAV